MIGEKPNNYDVVSHVGNQDTDDIVSLVAYVERIVEETSTNF